VDLAPDRLFDWRDALVLEPFRSSPYEDRYPIRLLEPESETEVNAAVVRLGWKFAGHIGSPPVVDLSFRHLPRGVRVGLVTLPAKTGNHLDIDLSALPPTFDPSKPAAWRVRAVDERGRTHARSGWRRLSWHPSPPPVTAPAKP
jgi:hypothetical protein